MSMFDYWNRSLGDEEDKEFMSENFATVDEEGRLILPGPVVNRFGLLPGEQVYFDVGDDTIRLHRPVNGLARIYVEPTTRCNMDCEMCQRRTWSDRPGDMSPEVFQKVLEALSTSRPRPSVVFGGFGEPLMHPGLMAMIEQCKELGAEVELISNGLLLNPDRMRELKDLQLDRLWLSVDGVSDRCLGHIRDRRAFRELVKNIKELNRSFFPNIHDRPRLGLVFVAMKDNIHELPEVLNLGQQVSADRVLISNILPYTREMSKQILHSRSIWHINASFFRVEMPRMDMCEDAMDVLIRAMRFRDFTDLFEREYPEPFDTCPFIKKRSLSVRWDGGISPCQPLLHSHLCFMGDLERKNRECLFGSLKDHGLLEIWKGREYTAFRKRVTTFDFSPCVSCASCELAESNEGDCFGNQFPTCGGCLWAQGLIRCP